MKWSTDFATGIDRIDDQHKMIFQVTDDFRAALDQGGGEQVYDSLLRSLDTYVRGHFRFEEGCMDQYRCPVAEKNREAHGKFARTFAGYRQRYEANGFDRREARALVDMIDEWLAAHICRIDVHLSRCVQTS